MEGGRGGGDHASKIAEERAGGGKKNKNCLENARSWVGKYFWSSIARALQKRKSAIGAHLPIIDGVLLEGESEWGGRSNSILSTFGGKKNENYG